MSYHKHDQSFAIGTLCLGGYLAYQSFSYPSESALFPRALSILLLAMSLVLLFKTILHLKKNRACDESGGQEDKSFPLSVIKIIKSPAVVVFGGALAYVGLIKTIGYVSATVIFMVSFMWILGYRKRMRIVIWASVFTGMLFFIFFNILGIPMPECLFIQ